MQIKFCHNLQGVGDFVVRVNPSNKLEKFLLLVFQYHGPHIGNSFFTMNCMFLSDVVDHVKFNLPTSRSFFTNSNYLYSNPSIVETTTQVLFFVLVLYDCHTFNSLIFFSQDVGHRVKLLSITWFSWFLSSLNMKMTNGFKKFKWQRLVFFE